MVLGGAKDTDELKKELRPWSKYKKLILSAPKSAFNDKRWRAGVIIPPSERSVEAALMALNDERPTAILMPSDLVHRIAQKSDRSFDPRITKLVDACKKIQFMRSGAVWLVSPNWGPAHDEVYNVESRTRPPAPPGVAGKYGAKALARWKRGRLSKPPR